MSICRLSFLLFCHTQKQIQSFPLPSCGPLRQSFNLFFRTTHTLPSFIVVSLCSQKRLALFFFSFLKTLSSRNKNNKNNNKQPHHHRHHHSLHSSRGQRLSKKDAISIFVLFWCFFFFLSESPHPAQGRGPFSFFCPYLGRSC